MTHNTMKPAIDGIRQLEKALGEMDPATIQSFGEYLERVFVLYYEDHPLPPELGSPVDDTLMVEMTESIRSVLAFNGYMPTPSFLDWHDRNLETPGPSADGQESPRTPPKERQP